MTGVGHRRFDATPLRKSHRTPARGPHETHSGPVGSEGLDRVPAHLRRSLTFDCGAEWANWRRLADHYDLQVWFCDPHSPWQRGQIENVMQLAQHSRVGSVHHDMAPSQGSVAEGLGSLLASCCSRTLSVLL